MATATAKCVRFESQKPGATEMHDDPKTDRYYRLQRDRVIRRDPISHVCDFAEPRPNRVTVDQRPDDTREWIFSVQQRSSIDWPRGICSFYFIFQKKVNYYTNRYDYRGGLVSWCKFQSEFVGYK